MPSTYSWLFAFLIPPHLSFLHDSYLLMLFIRSKTTLLNKIPACKALFMFELFCRLLQSDNSSLLFTFRDKHQKCFLVQNNTSTYFSNYLVSKSTRIFKQMIFQHVFSKKYIFLYCLFLRKILLISSFTNLLLVIFTDSLVGDFLKKPK